MAMQLIPGGLWIPRLPTAFSTQPSYTSTTLVIDASGEIASFVFSAPKSGNIKKVLWRSAAVSVNGTVDVRLETVSATNGDPTGTLVATNTNGSQTVNAANTMWTTTLTAAGAVTKGEKYAVSIVRDAVAGNIQVACFADELLYLPYSDLFTGTWAKQSQAPILGLEYDDGSYAVVEGCYPFQNLNSDSFSSASNPDVIGLKFKNTFPTRAVGFWLWGDLDGDLTVKLYSNDGVTVLASQTFDANIRQATNAGIITDLFPSPADLSKDVFYYLGVEPGGVSSTIYNFDVPTAACMDSFHGGQNYHYVTAKDPSGTGSWNATTTKRPFMGLLYDSFDDGVGGGSSLKSRGILTGGRL